MISRAIPGRLAHLPVVFLAPTLAGEQRGERCWGLLRALMDVGARSRRVEEVPLCVF